NSKIRHYNFRLNYNYLNKKGALKNFKKVL
ncbi:unnamed protein product, partial [marine sediment metagenome]